MIKLGRNKIFLALACLLLLVCSAGSALATNLVVNGDFETGDLNGWNTFPGTENPAFGVWNGYPFTGKYSAWFGAYGSTDDTITQTIPTVAGGKYTFDFWLAHNYSDNANDFSASWNGTPMLSLVDTNSFGYSHYLYNVTATGAASTIAFAGREVPAQYFLDDVKVAAPLCGTVFLLGSGLLCLLGWRRMQQG